MAHVPRYHANEIDARCQLDPNGDHRLLVETPNGIMLADFDIGQVRQLEQAIEKFNSMVGRADGGPDFHNRRTVQIEVRR